MIMSQSRSYSTFPVNITIDIKGTADVHEVVDNLVKQYGELGAQDRFSCRILLPKGDTKTTQLSKKIGMAIQTGILLGLRKNKLKPNIKEIRYIHDEDHYGWVLASPSVHETFERSFS
jgi:hypothetical protein